APAVPRRRGGRSSPAPSSWPSCRRRKARNIRTAARGWRASSARRRAPRSDSPSPALPRQTFSLRRLPGFPDESEHEQQHGCQREACPIPVKIGQLGQYDQVDVKHHVVDREKKERETGPEEQAC